MFATISPGHFDPFFLAPNELVIHLFALARQITNTLLALPEFQQSTNVSCFLSMPTGEVDTSAVVTAVLDAGKVAKIGIPHCFLSAIFC